MGNSFSKLGILTDRRNGKLTKCLGAKHLSLFRQKIGEFSSETKYFRRFFGAKIFALKLQRD
jgi:hypothetical protein